ncbi:hypothetical protein PsYK624_055550 [Phanerochaete sordida]|uniref:DUF6535 domain-containing protein n=1 Tax=Phanerochaete sordida TaxID=48140 RepID=A0A9P3LCD2_9APHY|nr:hypothetical protein PsYK624_055550 [Phanerochaete sordida]
MVLPTGSKNAANGALLDSSRHALLEGWAGIEDHLMRYDKGKVNGYSEDIDALLVFAGLFSAILSAFVVQTYQLLQPDASSATNQLLAYGFSSQRAAAPIPAAINATMNSILDSPPFVPSVSARWINSLFFISLVLSIAAALFGILSKQWIREYILWNSPLAAPRENVLVRQMRIEAWEAWNVTATISAVPALLEVAMILFLVGMVILLWTLDDVVAICVTAVVSLFLLVVSAFTILPVLFHRCPYRSPTAWACFSSFAFLNAQLYNLLHLLRLFSWPLAFRFKRLCEAALERSIARQSRMPSYSTSRRISPWRAFFTSAPHVCLVRLGKAVKDWKSPATHSKFRVGIAAWSSGLTDWRHLDLESWKTPQVQSGGRWKKLHVLRADAEQALSDECWELSEAGQCLEKSPVGVSPKMVQVNALLEDISHTTHLLQALSWVQRSSQDAHVSGLIDQCVEAIHAPEAASKSSTPFSVHMVTTWCVLHALKNNQLDQPQCALLPRLSTTGQSSVVTSLRASTGVHCVDDILSPRQNKHRTLSVDKEIKGSHIITIFARMVAADLKRISRTTPISEHPTQERRILELFNVLQALTESTVNQREEPWFIRALNEVFCVFAENSRLMPRLPAIFPVACQQLRITVRDNSRLGTSNYY